MYESLYECLKYYTDIFDIIILIHITIASNNK